MEKTEKMVLPVCLALQVNLELLARQELTVLKDLLAPLVHRGKPVKMAKEAMVYNALFHLDNKVE